MPSKQYNDARQAANDAFKVYVPIRDAYRAGKLSDAEFLAAQKAYFAVEALFDAAYALEVAGDE
jgi:outer membrane protein TolC